MHFPSVQRDGAVLKLDVHAAFDDDEHFVGVAVVVPDELALKFHQLELVVVHFSDDLGRPVVGKQGEFFREVDDAHDPSTTAALLGSMPQRGGRHVPAFRAKSSTWQ